MQNNSTCSKTTELLSPYIDGDLTSAEVTELEQHLAQCAGCRQQLQTLRLIVGEMHAMPKELRAPPNFAAQVTASIRTSATAREKATTWGLMARLPKMWRQVAAAAALILVAWASIGISHQFITPGTNSVADHKGSPNLSQLATKEHDSKATAQDLQTNQRPTAGEHNGLLPPPDNNQSTGNNIDKKSNANAGDNTKNTAKPGEKSVANSPNKAPANTGSQSTGLNANPKPPSHNQLLATTEAKVFLNKPRAIESVLMKVHVADIDQAMLEATNIVSAYETKGQSYGLQQVDGHQIHVTRYVVPRTVAELITNKFHALGQVNDKQKDTHELTNQFAQQLARYQSLINQSKTANPDALPALEAEIKQMEQQLITWDNESQQTVITLWLEQ